MSVNVNEIIRKLSPAERKKVEDRVAEIIAEERLAGLMEDSIWMATAMEFSTKTATSPSLLKSAGR